MWSARHNALMASLALAPGSKAMTTDVAVPVSELAGAIEHARRALDESGLRGGIVGHVGDGNFHVALPARPGRRRVDRAGRGAERRASSRTRSRAAARAPASTASASASSRYLEREHGDLLPLFRGIKQLFDPNGILNPGQGRSLDAVPRHRHASLTPTARSTSRSSSSVVAPRGSARASPRPSTAAGCAGRVSSETSPAVLCTRDARDRAGRRGTGSARARTARRPPARCGRRGGRLRGARSRRRRGAASASAASASSLSRATRSSRPCSAGSRRASGARSCRPSAPARRASPRSSASRSSAISALTGGTFGNRSSRRRSRTSASVPMRGYVGR